MAKLIDLATEAGIDVAQEPIYDVRETVPDGVRHWLETDRAAYRLWAGSQGYGASRKVIVAALEVGHDVPTDLVTLAAHRPAHRWAMATAAEREELARQLSRIVDQAIEDHRDRAAKMPSIDRVRVYLSDETVYEITARGRTFSVSAGDLLSVTRFQVAYLNHTGVAPLMPRPSRWVDLVNGYLAGAETIDLTAEGKHAYFVDVVRQALQRLAVIEEPSDEITRSPSVCLLPDGRALFTLFPLVGRVRAMLSGDITQPKVTRAVLELGCERAKVRVGGVELRAWVLPASLRPGGETLLENVVSHDFDGDGGP